MSLSLSRSFNLRKSCLTEERMNSTNQSFYPPRSHWIHLVEERGELNVATPTLESTNDLVKVSEEVVFTVRGSQSSGHITSLNLLVSHHKDLRSLLPDTAFCEQINVLLAKFSPLLHVDIRRYTSSTISTFAIFLPYATFSEQISHQQFFFFPYYMSSTKSTFANIYLTQHFMKKKKKIFFSKNF